jgi:hypothetical protein
MQRSEVRGAARPLYGTLGVKGLICEHNPDSQNPVRSSKISEITFYYLV